MYPAEDAQRLGDHGTTAAGLVQRQLTDSISITTPPTRKRQKKADSRVAELERKIDALTATLHAQKSGAPDIKLTEEYRNMRATLPRCRCPRAHTEWEASATNGRVLRKGLTQTYLQDTGRRRPSNEGQRRNGER